MWSHIWNSQPSATICLLGFWGTLSKPLLRSLSGTAHGHRPSLSDTTIWRAATSPPWENSWLSQAAEWFITQLFSQTWKADGNAAGDRWESWSPVACQWCSVDTFIRLFTLFWHPPWSARHQRLPTAHHMTAKKAVCTRAGWTPGQQCLSLLLPFITFYVVVVNMPPNFSCEVL